MEYIWKVNGEELCIGTEPSLFSPKGPDAGTLAMLEHVELKENDRVLDLGCGAGLVGIWAAKQVGGENVVMTDIDPLAVETSKKNLARNNILGVTVVCGSDVSAVPGKDFDYILSNPPYHTDFKVAKLFIEKGFNRLKIGGHMLLVTKRKDWYKNKMIAIFGGVRIYEKNGYLVFVSEKKSENFANKIRKKFEK
ncbi:MAG: class I SAM-dependent methyltransferase [Clostridiales bacterium]|nr:class I SAM-dependent methyltransferase [Clostridiales bacterium]